MRESEAIEKKISVIVPVYNAEKYIDDTLKDLISQTYGNLEIIIIDDGSTDNSQEIIQKYSKQDNRIIVLKGAQKGPSMARNKGLEVATGEYIRFVDADDRLNINSISYLYEAYKKDTQIDLVIGNFSTDENKEYFTGRSLKEDKISARAFAEIFITHAKSFYFGVPWNKLYKRSIIEEYHIRFDEKIVWCEDFLFNIEYYSKCQMMYFINRPEGVYKYCIRETGITSNIKYRDSDEINRIEALRYDQMKKYCIEFDLLDRFELEWKYADLYEKLSNTTKYLRNDFIWVKYELFKGYLREEDVYHYISVKWEETNSAVWKWLKEAKQRERYLKAFLLFIMKGFQQRYLLLGKAKEIRDEEVSVL